MRNSLYVICLSLSLLSIKSFAFAKGCNPTGQTYSDTEFSQQSADQQAEVNCNPNRGPGEACVDQGCTQDTGNGLWTCSYEIYDCN